jgi:hypothetical protein
VGCGLSGGGWVLGWGLVSSVVGGEVRVVWCGGG